MYSDLFSSAIPGGFAAEAILTPILRWLSFCCFLKCLAKQPHLENDAFVGKAVYLLQGHVRA